MANRKARSTERDPGYLSIDPYAFWAYVLKDTPPPIQSQTFPLAGAPTRAYLAEMNRFVRRLAREKANLLDAQVHQAITEEKANSPDASARELAVWVSEKLKREVSRHQIKKVLNAMAFRARLDAYLERTLPQRLKKKSPLRPTTKKQIRRKP